jgi:hypothetical protein
MHLKTLSKAVRAGAVAVLAAGVSACGVDGVELNGKIFDAMGVNSAPEKKDVKLAERQPLVVPPRMAALPEPGSGSSETQLAEVKDHDADIEISQEELAKRQAEYCRKHYDANLAVSDASVDNVKGPAGPCRKSILSAVSQFNSSSDEE